MDLKSTKNDWVHKNERNKVCSLDCKKLFPFRSGANLYSGIFYFSSSPINPEVAPSGAEEPGVQGGVQVHPPILSLSPSSDERYASQSPLTDVEINDVIIDISQTR